MAADEPAVETSPAATGAAMDAAMRGATETSTPASWRELAVARSLDPARLRAEKRVQRFLDAALELMTTSAGKEFTVQEVVERSGQSLRSFYQYFAGKYELLLALFEESVRSTAEHLERVVAAEDDPSRGSDASPSSTTGRASHRRKASRSKGRTAKNPQSPAMAQFAQQLLTEHPKEAARAFTPLVALLERAARRSRRGRRHPPRAAPPPDRRRRAPGDHVQRLRHDDQWLTASARRRGSGRRALGPAAPRHPEPIRLSVRGAAHTAGSTTASISAAPLSGTRG